MLSIDESFVPTGIASETKILGVDIPFKLIGVPSKLAGTKAAFGEVFSTVRAKS